MKFNIEKINALSLADLQALYELIDSGIYDGNSTKRISCEAEGFHYSHETWKARLVERKEILNNIQEVMKMKINNII